MNTIRFRHAVLGLVLGCSAHCALAAGALQLISNEEFMQEKQFAASRTRSVDLHKPAVPGAPVIELSKPKLNDTLKAPFPIQLVFKASDDAEVLPETFKVFYGFMKLDITDRVVKNTKVTKTGLTVDQADIPAGTHKLLLQITDSKNRKTEMPMSFTVE
jgi:hypothetical protein